MAPLAKTITETQSYGSEFVAAVSAFQWSSTFSLGAPPPLTAAPKKTLKPICTCKGCHRTDFTKQRKFTARHSVLATVRAIITFLERNGVSKDDIAEMEEMFEEQEYVEIMVWSREFVDDLYPELCDNPHFDLEALLFLFSGAWDALVDYSENCHTWAYKNYQKYEIAAWEEAIVQQGLPPKEQLARQKRRLAEYDPEEIAKWKGSLNKMTRFKIDCGKGAVQMIEWSRILRVQKRCHDHRAAK